jgi:hypothetical protein
MTHTKNKTHQQIKQAEYYARYYEANKEAYKTKAKEYYETNKKEVIEKNLRKRKTDPKTVMSMMVTRCRRRDTLQGRTPDIDVEYVRSIWPEDNCCPVFKTPFTIGNSSVKTNASIDRIDPSRGYVKGNIIIVSFRANTIKNDASINELQTVAEFYSRLAVDQTNNA